MPVGGAQLQRRRQGLRVVVVPHAKDHVGKHDKSAYQVQPMDCCQQVEVTGGRAARNVEAHGLQVHPQIELRNQEQYRKEHGGTDPRHGDIQFARTRATQSALYGKTGAGQQGGVEPQARRIGEGLPGLAGQRFEVRVLGARQEGDDEEEEIFVLVEDDEWTQDHKYQSRSQIWYYPARGVHFMVSESRSGSYHTDWYYNPPEVDIVTRHEKVVTRTEVEWRVTKVEEVQAKAPCAKA